MLDLDWCYRPRIRKDVVRGKGRTRAPPFVSVGEGWSDRRSNDWSSL